MFTARGYVCTSIFGLILTEKHYPEGWGLDQPTNVRTSQPTRGDVTSFLSAVHRQGHPQPVLPPPYSHCVDPPPPYESIYQQSRADSYPGSWPVKFHRLMTLCITSHDSGSLVSPLVRIKGRQLLLVLIQKKIQRSKWNILSCLVWFRNQECSAESN